MLYMVAFTIKIPPMLAYIPYIVHGSYGYINLLIEDTLFSDELTMTWAWSLNTLDEYTLRLANSWIYIFTGAQSDCEPKRCLECFAGFIGVY